MQKLKTFTVGAIVAFTASMVNAADNVTVQLKWVTQTQFAGYYVAQDKGFYEAEGLNVNIKAAFNIAKLCTNKMLKLKSRKKIGGSIIHTSSMFGLVAGPNRTVYSMTKFGIEGLTKGMAVDLAKFNIRVNSVCPTFVATPRAKKYLANKEFRKYALDNIPLGRIATESDVATAITYLSSNASSMITGTSVIIDGGWTTK